MDTVPQSLRQMPGTLVTVTLDLQKELMATEIQPLQVINGILLRRKRSEFLLPSGTLASPSMTSS